MSEAIRMAAFISQMEAGRSPAVAAMVVEAMFPFDKLGEGWAGANRRKVSKLARQVAKNANPKKGWNDTMLLGLLSITFQGYGSLCAYQSKQQHYWVCHYMWAQDPQRSIKELLAEIGM